MGYKKGLIGYTVEYMSKELYEGKVYHELEAHLKTGVAVDKVKTRVATFYLIIDELGKISRVEFYRISRVIPVIEFEKVTD